MDLLPLPPYPVLDISSLSDVLEDALPPPPPQSVLEDFMVDPYEVDISSPPVFLENSYMQSCQKLLIDQFIYRKYGDNNGKKYWKCIDEHCASKCHTVNGEIVKWVKQTHTHLPVHGKAQVEIVLSQAKERAMSTTESIRSIVEFVTSNIPSRFSELKPADEALKRSLRRFRQRAGVRDLETSRRTVDGEEFLRYQTDDMVVFAADCDLRELCNSQHWFADGTFKVSPRGFYQQYTIHAFLDGVTYPCVSALLPGKSEAVYDRLLRVLEPLFPSTPAPETILTDFEKAAMNAFSKRFPEATINGCHFHLGQSLWRKVQNLGLGQRYKADDAFAVRVRRLLGLAFVPVDQVHDHMDLILEEEVPKEELMELLRYFRDTYVGQRLMTRGQQSTILPAQFPPSTWNLYDRVKNDLPRTNNSLEGFHSAFAKDMVAHPDLYKLADKYRKLQHKKLHDRIQHSDPEGRPPASRKQYVAATARFKELIGRFDRRVLIGLPYLDKVSKSAKIRI